MCGPLWLVLLVLAAPNLLAEAPPAGACLEDEETDWISLQQVNIRRISGHDRTADLSEAGYAELRTGGRTRRSAGRVGMVQKVDPFILNPENGEVWPSKGKQFVFRWNLVFWLLVIVLAPIPVVLSCCQRGIRCPGSPPLEQLSGQLFADRISTERREAAFAESRIMLKKTVFAASLCHFCMGYYTGIIAGAALFLRKDPMFVVDNQQMDGLTSGAIVSFMMAGAAVGAGCGFVADWIGRRNTLLWVALLYVLGALLMCMSKDVQMLCIGRAVAGFGVGLSSGVVNLYILEVVPGDARGHFGLFAPMMSTLGLVSAYATSLLLGVMPHGWWRVQLGLGIVPALFVVLLKGWLHETPRWLLSRGQRQEAKKSLSALFPSVAGEIIDSELDQLSLDISKSASDQKAGLLRMIWKYRFAFLLGAAINVLQQATGIHIMIYFSPTLLQLVGFSQFGSLFLTLVISLLQVATVFSNALIVDRIGRRPVALSGTLVIMLGLALLSGGFFAAGHGAIGPMWPKVCVVVGMFLFGAAFAFSLGPLPYIMTSELFPQEARAWGCAVSWMANWTASFLVCQSFPILMDVMYAHWGKYASCASIIFSVYLGFTILSFIFIGCLLPERVPKLDVVRD